jgi:hypothetical protein
VAASFCGLYDLDVWNLVWFLLSLCWIWLATGTPSLFLVSGGTPTIKSIKCFCISLIIYKAPRLKEMCI